MRSLKLKTETPWEQEYLSLVTSTPTKNGLREMARQVSNLNMNFQRSGKPRRDPLNRPFYLPRLPREY